MPHRAVAGGRVRRRTRAAALGCALVTTLALAGCGAQEPDAKAAADDTGGTTPGATAPSTTVDQAVDTALDPALAVPAPGPRSSRLESADLLVNAGSVTIPDELIARLKKLDGVTSALQVELAQVPVEGKALNVLGVDPGTYRNYTPAASADLQEMWDRVARGEVAVPSTTPTRAIDDAGNFALGSVEGSPEIHVGAFGDQVPFIDAVVNQKWGEKLAMQPGNALILSTGISSPAKVQKDVQKIVGDDISVQALDQVAQLGLDIGAFQQAFLVGSVADAVGTFRYSVLGGGRIAPDPGWVSSHISSETVPILGTVTCNTKLFPQLKAALGEIVQQGLADKIDPGQYAGCYYPRFIAGSDRLSNHAFGLALDLNTPGNQRGTVGEMDRGVVAIFKRWGFAWGGDWRYTDPMHFEMAALVKAG